MQWGGESYIRGDPLPVPGAGCRVRLAMQRFGLCLLLVAASALVILAVFCAGVSWTLMVVPASSGWRRALCCSVGVVWWLFLLLCPGAILVVHHLVLFRAGELWPLPWITAALALIGGLVLIGTVGLRVYFAAGGLWV